MANPMMCEISSVRLDKWQVDDAERAYHIVKSGGTPGAAACQQRAQNTTSSLVNEIAKVRQHIQKSLNTDITSGSTDNIVVSRFEALELDNKELRKVTEDLQSVVKKLESRIAALEVAGSVAPAQKTVEKPVSKQEEAGEDEDDDDDDDDFDMFGSGDEADAEAERIKAERVAAYQAKKAKKPVLIAKSNVILDVKPWGDDTDMVALEKCVRSIEMDGLLWGTGKLVAVGYGIKKLTISTVVVDDKVSIEDLTDQIEAFEDHVQSVDIAAFNKI